MVLLGALCATPAAADRTTGTWTGAAEVRGNYYWERSTRVIAPEVGLDLEAPNGVRLHADYLVDSITSASQAAGALVDLRFTEIRHDVTFGAGYEFDLGDAQLDLDGSYRRSTEPDYVSNSGTVSAALSLNQRSTILRSSITLLHDEINQIFRIGSRQLPGMDGTPRGSFDQDLDSIVTSVGVDQVLSPNVTFQLAYAFAHMRGFLANPYRSISFGVSSQPETHPGTRLRHTVNGRLGFFIPQTETAVHLLYRAYLDSWDIGALTPELRVYQDLGGSTVLRTRYRYYTQTRAFFFKPADRYEIGERLVSADPKMSEFHSHLFGLQLALELQALDGTVLDALRETRIDLNFDYIWSTSSFGDGVIAEIGLRVPF